MIDRRPVLKEIHDTFDVFPKYPHTDHSVISGIAITGREDGYQVTTFPGGTGRVFDSFAIDVHAPGGMFTDEPPTLVETRRDFRPQTPLRVQPTLNVLPQRVLIPPETMENQTGPNDFGYDLFQRMQSQIQGLRVPLQNAIATAGVDIQLTSFGFRESSGHTIANVETQSTTHRRKAHIQVQTSDSAVEVTLDASTVTAIGARPNAVVMFNSGTLTAEGQTVGLGFDALMAFTGLHAAIQQLYTE